MSLHSEVEIDCPSCGVRGRVELWSSINTTIDPEARDKLISGDLNVFHCPSCGTRTLCRSGLLYHDMRRGFAVFYIPPERLEGDAGALLDDFTRDGEVRLPFVSEESAHLQKAHVVFDRKEMLLFMAFRERLHDRRQVAKGHARAHRRGSRRRRRRR